MASEDQNSTFNLYQELLVFTDKASRSGRIAVPREDYVRNLRRGFRGVPFRMVTEALQQLESRGLVKIEWLGPENFNVTLTVTAIGLLHEAPRAASSAQRSQSGSGGGRSQGPGSGGKGAPSRRPPQEEWAENPVGDVKEAPSRPQKSSQPKAIPRVSPPGETPSRAQEETPPPRIPPTPKPSPEEVKISTFGDLEAKPEPRPLDPERLATKRNEMNDWLSSQLTVLGEREEAVNRRDDELRSREEMLSRWEREALERVEEMEKKFQTALTNVMDELARQEKVLPDFYKSIGADRSSVAEWLKPIKECEARIDELERERAGIRRAIKEARDALGQHGSSG